MRSRPTAPPDRHHGSAALKRSRPTPADLDDETLAKHVRRTLACTWVDLADALGVSVDAVHRWKKGESPIPPRRRARLLALRCVVLTDRLFVVTFAREQMPPKRRARRTPTTLTHHSP